MNTNKRGGETRTGLGEIAQAILAPGPSPDLAERPAHIAMMGAGVCAAEEVG